MKSKYVGNEVKLFSLSLAINKRPVGAGTLFYYDTSHWLQLSSADLRQLQIKLGMSYLFICYLYVYMFIYLFVGTWMLFEDIVKCINNH